MRFIDALDALPASTLHLTNSDNVLEHAAGLHGVEAVALHFPKWTDGRAYSQARLLRSRLRFAGDILATGEVLVDMLPLLQRSGFDAAQLRTDQDVAAAQRALRFFAAHYQADLVSKLPLFARGAAS